MISASSPALLSLPRPLPNEPCPPRLTVLCSLANSRCGCVSVRLLTGVSHTLGNEWEMRSENVEVSSGFQCVICLS